MTVADLRSPPDSRSVVAPAQTEETPMAQYDELPVSVTPAVRVRARTITMRTTMSVVVRDAVVGLDLALGFDPADPYAVVMSFGEPSTQPVRWFVGRDLLAQSLAEAVGEGDVRAWPSLDQQLRPVVAIDLCSPEGRLVGSVPAEDLDLFLSRSERLVPFGEESLHLDMDSLLAELSGNAPA